MALGHPTTHIAGLMHGAGFVLFTVGDSVLSPEHREYLDREGIPPNVCE
jgi:hypothetical protein